MLTLGFLSSLQGHYRYSQAFYALEKLDQAIEANWKGQHLCKKSTDHHNYTELEDQGNKFDRGEIRICNHSSHYVMIYIVNKNGLNKKIYK